jgi:hypothetical protein
MKTYQNSSSTSTARNTARFHHQDDLSAADDAELQQQAGALYDAMKARHIALGSSQAIPYETELAFIQRE